jgi:hypothetical protein
MWDAQNHSLRCRAMCVDLTGDKLHGGHQLADSHKAKAPSAKGLKDGRDGLDRARMYVMRMDDRPR